LENRDDVAGGEFFTIRVGANIARRRQHCA
jgi:hypothetical protein